MGKEQDKNKLYINYMPTFSEVSFQYNINSKHSGTRTQP